MPARAEVIGGKDGSCTCRYAYAGALAAHRFELGDRLSELDPVPGCPRGRACVGETYSSRGHADRSALRSCPTRHSGDETKGGSRLGGAERLWRPLWYRLRP